MAKRLTIKTRPKIEIIESDCIKGIPETVKPGSVDVVVTSPPYNIGIDYNRYNDRLPLDEYLEWMLKWGRAVKLALKNNGSLFLNIGSRPKSPDTPFRVVEVLQQVFKLQNVIHWIKSIYIETESYNETTRINVGHYKPINSARFLNDTHEYIFHLTKTAAVPIDRLALGVPYKDKTNIGRWKNGRDKLRCRGNCWFIPYRTIQNRNSDRPHPASFPPELAENCIKLHGLKKRMLVMDPFSGIGNTALACQQLGVKFIGFEIDPYYISESEKRLQPEAGGA